MSGQPAAIVVSDDVRVFDGCFLRFLEPIDVMHSTPRPLKNSLRCCRVSSVQLSFFAQLDLPSSSISLHYSCFMNHDANLFCHCVRFTLKFNPSRVNKKSIVVIEILTTLVCAMDKKLCEKYVFLTVVTTRV